MKIETQEGRKSVNQQDKYRSDSEVPITVSEEEVKLAEVIVQTNRNEGGQASQPASGWIARLCFCFPATNRRRRNERKDNGPLLPPQLPHIFGKPRTCFLRPPQT